MSEAEHTPGEWVCDGYNVRQPCGRYIAYTGPSHTPPHEYPKACELEDKANAAFIVRACNAHDDLLAACEKAEVVLAKLDTLRHLDKSFGPLDELRAAIAKAKGGAA